LYLFLSRRIKAETQTQRYLLQYYAGRADKDGRFSVGVKLTAEETGLSEHTVNRTNADFKQVGILTWTKGHGNRFTGIEGAANAYQFDLQRFQQLPFISISKPQPKSRRSLLEGMVYKNDETRMDSGAEM